jgi:hypothetical protein
VRYSFGYFHAQTNGPVQLPAEVTLYLSIVDSLTYRAASLCGEEMPSTDSSRTWEWAEARADQAHGYHL